MEFLTIEGAGAFILLVLPGAISLQVYRMILPGKPLVWSEVIPQGLFYSLLNFGVLFPVVRFLLNGGNLHEHPIAYWASLLLCLLAAPVAWPILYRLVLTWSWLRARVLLPYPTAWDFHFGQRRPAFVLVTLVDGRLVGGYYGPRSYATSFPNDGDIYFEMAMELTDEGQFGDFTVGSAGILLRKDQYRLLEFFALPNPGGVDGTS